MNLTPFSMKKKKKMSPEKCSKIFFSIFSEYQRQLILWPDDVSDVVEYMKKHCHCYNDSHFLLKVLQVAMQFHPEVIKAWNDAGEDDFTSANRDDHYVFPRACRDHHAQLKALELVDPRIRSIVASVTIAVGGLRELKYCPDFRRALIRAAGGFEADMVAEEAKKGELGQREIRWLKFEAERAAAAKRAAERAADREFLQTYRFANEPRLVEGPGRS